jgi:hypothetical protein
MLQLSQMAMSSLGAFRLLHTRKLLFEEESVLLLLLLLLLGCSSHPAFYCTCGTRCS